MNNSSIPVCDMQDGDIGMITEWDDRKEYVGRIIQRYGNSFISLGRRYGESWTNAFDTLNGDDRRNKYRVITTQYNEVYHLISSVIFGYDTT